MKKIRILFIAEAVTLAHITRPYVLACGLNEELFEIHFACSQFNTMVFRKKFFKHWVIKSISTEAFIDNLANSRPTHSFETLQQYVNEEIKLIEDVCPHIIVGDFRISLSVSARLAKIPYINITNAYWSYNLLHPQPVYDHILFNLLGPNLGKLAFILSKDIISHIVTGNINKLRMLYGLKKYSNICEAYTDGDITLFCDTPTLVPLSTQALNQHYIGPVHWSPAPKVSDFDQDLPNNKPIIFLSLGSSGDQTLLPKIISLLSALPVSLVVSTAGRTTINNPPANVYISDFVPGDLYCRKSDLVITNGGSGMSYQALKHGVPVIGITSNYDQMLCMDCIKNAGAGFYLKANSFRNDVFLNHINNILFNAQCKTQAMAIKNEFEGFNPNFSFNKIITKAKTNYLPQNCK